MTQLNAIKSVCKKRALRGASTESIVAYLRHLIDDTYSSSPDMIKAINTLIDKHQKKAVYSNKAQALINSKSIKELCEMFVMTNDRDGMEIPTVRGWIMDRLEELNQVAFDSWIDTDDVDLMDDPTNFFVKTA